MYCIRRRTECREKTTGIRSEKISTGTWKLPRISQQKAGSNGTRNFIYCPHPRRMRLNTSRRFDIMEIKRILFPTDFSDGALNALPYALDMAKSYGAKLYLLHVIYDIATSSGLHIPHISVDEMYKELDASARKEIERFGLEQRRVLKDV
ncbi:MAG TPA: hypothetical protein DCP24_12635, partial [Nitrospiraceae bacterium]|nr:hypothetical protein [Nitrospiraceae bacterium]